MGQNNLFWRGKTPKRPIKKYHTSKSLHPRSKNKIVCKSHKSLSAKEILITFFFKKKGFFISNKICDGYGLFYNANCFELEGGKSDDANHSVTLVIFPPPVNPPPLILRILAALRGQRNTVTLLVVDDGSGDDNAAAAYNNDDNDGDNGEFDF